MSAVCFIIQVDAPPNIPIQDASAAMPASVGFVTDDAINCSQPPATTAGYARGKEPRLTQLQVAQ